MKVSLDGSNNNHNDTRIFLIQWNAATLIHEIVALIKVYLVSNVLHFVALSMEFLKTNGKMNVIYPRIKQYSQLTIFFIK